MPLGWGHTVIDATVKFVKVSVSAAHTDESLRGEMPWEQIPPTGREKRPAEFKTISIFIIRVCCAGHGFDGEELFSILLVETFGMNHVLSLCSSKLTNLQRSALFICCLIISRILQDSAPITSVSSFIGTQTFRAESSSAASDKLNSYTLLTFITNQLEG